MKTGKLEKKYGVPPFSILRADMGNWQQKKNKWNEMMSSEKGRKENISGSNKRLKHFRVGTKHMAITTSKFDPYLCELIYKWFCPPAGKILDPFAGGSVRGVVAGELGYRYTGIDLSKTQVEENIRQYQNNNVKWVVGDSNNIISLVDKDSFDFIFSCPPYYDLEVYSDDEADISTLTYDGFIDKYNSIISHSISMLKPNRFACFVVGEIRNKKTGVYRSFVADTINAFIDGGMDYYNEMILATPLGASPVIAGRHFKVARKVCKIHQNVLVFIKGDPKKATKAIGDINFTEGKDDTQNYLFE